MQLWESKWRRISKSITSQGFHTPSYPPGTPLWSETNLNISRISSSWTYHLLKRISKPNFPYLGFGIFPNHSARCYCDQQQEQGQQHFMLLANFSFQYFNQSGHSLLAFPPLPSPHDFTVSWLTVYRHCAVSSCGLREPIAVCRAWTVSHSH